MWLLDLAGAASIGFGGGWFFGWHGGTIAGRRDGIHIAETNRRRWDQVTVAVPGYRDGPRNPPEHYTLGHVCDGRCTGQIGR